jgi:hypothetical protein
MDGGTLRVQPNVGGTSAERNPGRIHRKDALWRTGDLESVEGPLCLSDGQIRLASIAEPGVRSCGEHWQLHTARRSSGGKFSTCLGIAHCLPEPAGVQGHHRLDVSDPGSKLSLAGVLGELPGRDAVGPGGLIVTNVERQVPQQAGQPTSRHIQPPPLRQRVSTTQHFDGAAAVPTKLIQQRPRWGGHIDQPQAFNGQVQVLKGRGTKVGGFGLAAELHRLRRCIGQQLPDRSVLGPATVVPRQGLRQQHRSPDRGGAAQPLAPIHRIVPCPEQLRVIKQQPQALLIQPAWPLLTPLPLRHHAGINADPDGEALPGDQRHLLGDLLLGQPEPVAMPLQPKIGDVASSRPHGRLPLSAASARIVAPGPDH